MGLKYCYLKQYYDCQAASFFVFTMAIPKDLTFVFLSVFLFFSPECFTSSYIILQSLTDHTQFKDYTEAGDDI